MKKTLITTTIILSGATMFTAFTFAKWNTIKPNNSWKFGSWFTMSWHMDRSSHMIWTWNMQKENKFLNQFIDYDKLSDTQKAEIKSILNELSEKTKSLKDTILEDESNKENIEQEIKTVWKEHMTSLSNYIESDKKSEFETFINNWCKAPWKSEWKNKWEKNSSQNTTSQKNNELKYFKWSTYTGLKNKLDKFDDNKLNLILWKINNMIDELNNDTSWIKNKDTKLEIYTEFREIIKSQLWTEETNEEEDLLNTLLEE